MTLNKMGSILSLAVGATRKYLNFIFLFLTGNYFQQTISPSAVSRNMKTIVVLGASVSGVEAAHRLLKQAAKTDPVKIVLISPNTHLYWNIATTRAIIPGQISTEDLFQEIAPGFKQYAPGQFEFITATAKHLNLEDKTVTVSAATGQKLINYDMLILATGSSVNTGDFPFKGRGSTQETKDALLAFQERVKNAKSIVVAGAGLTGVETAGSLAYEYGTKKQVILVRTKI